MKRAVRRTLNSVAFISENFCRMHRGSPRRAASTSSGTWGRNIGSSQVPTAVAGPDLALRAQENCSKRAQQTIKNVNTGQMASREQMLQLARVVAISHPHGQQTIELPQSRDPPEQAQLGCVSSGGIVSLGTPRPTAARELSPPPAILDGVRLEKTPEPGHTFKETAACIKPARACKSRNWSWTYQAQMAEQFHVELDMEHVAPSNRIFRWERNEFAERWQVCEQQGPLTLLEAENVFTPQHPEPLKEEAQLPGSDMSHTRGSMCAHVHMTQEHVHVPAAGSAVEPGWDSRKKSETYFPEAVWDKPYKPPYVHVVNSAEGARRVMQLLRTLVEEDVAAANSHSPVNDYGRKYWSRRIFACDTEATDIDVTSECAAGHGRVTCWTAYCGPDVNFARDDLAVQPGVVPECVLYVDTYLSGDDDLPAVLEIWSALRAFLESDDYPKVWHNYGFDKHILQRRGFGIMPAKLKEHGHDPDKLSLSLGGFAGDTMHMARLHDAARKGTKNYSLASLTSDKTVMCSPERSVLTRSKVSLKELFSRPKISKSGKPSASLKELPPIHEVQTAEDERMKWKWVDYSAFDSKATWDLYHSLREKLQATNCTVDEDLRPGMRGSLPTYSQWDLYLDVLWPFGEALTAMEQEGFYVDKPHLAEQDVKAQADLHDAEVRFRTWLRKYAAVVGQGNEDLGWHPDDIPGLVNLSSPSQIQTLLFGGFTAAKDVLKKPTKAEAEAGMKEHMVKPSVEIVRQFMMDNPKYGEPGERRQMPFKLTCVFGSQGTAIAHDCVTMVTAAQGLPMTSAAALRALCGKPGAAKKLLKELDTSNVHAAGAEAAEALADVAATIPEADGGHVSSADDASDGEARVCVPSTLQPFLVVMKA